MSLEVGEPGMWIIRSYISDFNGLSIGIIEEKDRHINTNVHTDRVWQWHALQMQLYEGALKFYAGLLHFGISSLLISSLIGRHYTIISQGNQ